MKHKYFFIVNFLCFLQDYVEQCLLEINKMIRDSTEAEGDVQNGGEENEVTTPRPDEFTPPLIKNHEHQTAVLTPTDVHDVHF